jgi:hypothetical protein
VTGRCDCGLGRGFVADSCTRGTRVGRLGSHPYSLSISSSSVGESHLSQVGEG